MKGTRKRKRKRREERVGDGFLNGAGGRIVLATKGTREKKKKPLGVKHRSRRP